MFLTNPLKTKRKRETFRKNSRREANRKLWERSERLHFGQERGEKTDRIFRRLPGNALFFLIRIE